MNDLKAEKIGFKLALFDLSSMLIKPLVKQNKAILSNEQTQNGTRIDLLTNNNR